MPMVDSIDKTNKLHKWGKRLTKNLPRRVPRAAAAYFQQQKISYKFSSKIIVMIRDHLNEGVGWFKQESMTH